MAAGSGGAGGGGNLLGGLVGSVRSVASVDTVLNPVVNLVGDVATGASCAVAGLAGVLAGVAVVLTTFISCTVNIVGSVLSTCVISLGAMNAVSESYSSELKEVREQTHCEEFDNNRQYIHQYNVDEINEEAFRATLNQYKDDIVSSIHIYKKKIYNKYLF